MKVIFVHYFFTDNGVTRSVLNNIKGLKQIAPDLEFALVADSFSSQFPDYVEKRLIDWSSNNLVESLESLTNDADSVIIENPVVGMFPKVTLAFKNFVEKNPDKDIIYRIHDFVDDRPHLFEKFLEIFPDVNSIYPRTNNITFITLTESDKKRLEEKGFSNVCVLPNSVIVADLVSDKEKAGELRKFLEKEKMVLPGEKILFYPVRLEKRKNVEEALLATKILNNSGENYRLIVTLPFLEDYKDSLKTLAEEFNIPCSLGEAGEFIGFDGEGFTTAEMFAISDLAITTSVREGFGFAYVEPWISETPLIGRKIPEVTLDFERNGVNLSHLYGNSALPVTENFEERLSLIHSILSDETKLKELSERLDLKKRIERALLLAKSNSEKAVEKYGHVNVARQLLSHIAIPKCIN